MFQRVNRNDLEMRKFAKWMAKEYPTSVLPLLRIEWDDPCVIKCSMMPDHGMIEISNLRNLYNGSSCEQYTRSQFPIYMRVERDYRGELYAYWTTHTPLPVHHRSDFIRRYADKLEEQESTRLKKLEKLKEQNAYMECRRVKMMQKQRFDSPAKAFFTALAMAQSVRNGTRAISCHKKP